MDVPGAPRWALRAGPLSLVFEPEDGSLRQLRLGAREVLRRVYVTVRDGRWVTIPVVQLSDLVVESGDDQFAVSFLAEHRGGEAQFRWRGTIRGDARGTIRFEMEGEALTTFQRNRIGLCVLHPIDECAGRPCRVEQVGGGVVDGEFPELIAPHQPFTDIRAISHEAAPGVKAVVTFEGEAFEMEDQRNWSDASYKTYSTPQALPKPVEIAAGTQVHQNVTLRLEGAPPPSIAIAPEPEEIDFAPVEGVPAVPLPRLGTALPSWRAEPLTAGERGLLAALRLAHLRADLVPSRADFARAFALAADEAAALALPLEVALSLSPDGARAELDLFAAAWQRRRPALASVAILPLSRGVSPLAALSLARQRLASVLGRGSVPLAGGSNAHFTELNRERAVALAVDVLSFPSTPLVHLTDDDTLVENLAAPAWIAETARSFAAVMPLALSPVTLRRLPAPPPPLGADAPAPGAVAFVDSRQSSTLAAGWMACHLARVARAGFQRVTYFQATGTAGLIPGEAAGQGSGDEAPAAPGAVFPLYDVLAALAELPGAQVVATRSSAPLAVDGLVVRQGDTTLIFLANFARAPRVVRLPRAWAAGRIRRRFEDQSPAGAPEPLISRAAAPHEGAATRLSLGPRTLVLIEAGQDEIDAD